MRNGFQNLGLLVCDTVWFGKFRMNLPLHLPNNMITVKWRCSKDGDRILFWNIYYQIAKCWPGSVVGIATGYGLDGPGIDSRWGARFSISVQIGPGAYPAFCTMGTWSFPGVNSGRGVTLTPHLLLVPWSRKGGSIPLLSLWDVRPVQSLIACARVHFTFTLRSKVQSFITQIIKLWIIGVVETSEFIDSN
jgi:hypothetical protein